MNVCVLASGSKGNCTYVETKNHKILIDVGTSFLYLNSKLNELNVNVNEIDTILITHTHSDHVKCLKRFTKQFHPRIYISDLMVSELDFEINDYIVPNENINLDEVKISVIKTSHDRLDSNAYIIEDEKNSVVYITDTGYINQKYFNLLKNRTIYVFESNHDVEMLMQGKKRHDIKMRVLGDSGHLSNKDSAYYLSKFVGPHTKKIILAHLSEDDNKPEIALDNLKDVLSSNSISFSNIEIAMQNERTELITL